METPVSCSVNNSTFYILHFTFYILHLTSYMIDTHCHIDDEQYSADFVSFLAAQQQGGVTRILVPATDVASCETVLSVCESYPDYLLPAFGLHPESVDSDWLEQVSAIRAKAVGVPLIAIGEIGLDYHWDTTFRTQQLEALRWQLDWAIEQNLPVMLHSRDATEDMLVVLREYAPKGLRGVMHCYSGSVEVARELISMGFYLGIGGVLTFKNCKLATVLESIPLDRLVLETDAPYMAPVPHRGERNEPRWISYVIERLCQVYQISPDEIEKQTDFNAKSLFRL